MARVLLTIVTDNYNRIQALRDGEVKVEGCEVTYLNLARSRRDLPYRAIPVAASRTFAHGSIWVREGGPIADPADLKGATIGMPTTTSPAGCRSRGC